MEATGRSWRWRGRARWSEEGERKAEKAAARRRARERAAARRWWRGEEELLGEEMETAWAAAMRSKETPASANGRNPAMADRRRRCVSAGSKG